MLNIAKKNEELKRLYGNRVDTNQPNFRLVEARNLTERRYGKHRIETVGGLFLREEVGWVECLKYPEFQDFLILERLFPNFNPEEMPGIAFTYEPIWVFKYDDDKRVPNNAVNKMVDMIMHRLMNRSKEENKTQKDLDIEEKGRIEKERQQVEDTIDTTPLESALHDGDAVFLDSKKKFKKEKVTNARNDDSLIITT